MVQTGQCRKCGRILGRLGQVLLGRAGSGRVGPCFRPDCVNSGD